MLTNNDLGKIKKIIHDGIKPVQIDVTGLKIDVKSLKTNVKSLEANITGLKKDVKKIRKSLDISHASPITADRILRLSRQPVI
ncbi:MAG: hypothetical protein UU21_C0020G0003 [Candidatus Levybacteria bacterium GW2011_GWA2_40_8]|nr:MAG: hypothetical protein UU21_C0020G0003 [Candidatus Levybacteria bacterium GW2011_GWA2_40_8]